MGDAENIVRSLNDILRIADSMDETGIGVWMMTNGRTSTRDALRTELGHFLLYIADGASNINEGQSALFNVVSNKEIPSWRIKELARSIGRPAPEKSLTALAFQQADRRLSQANGKKTDSMKSTLVSTYNAFGVLMLSMNENQESRIRFDGFMHGLKYFFGFPTREPEPIRQTSPQSKPSPTPKPAPKPQPATPVPKTVTIMKPEPIKTVNNTARTQLKTLIKRLSDNHEKCHDTLNVTILTLTGTLDQQKFTGIHDVKELEWISPNCMWAMRVPVGFSYTLDTDHTAIVQHELGIRADGHIQLTGYTNFGKERYSEPFGMDFMQAFGKAVRCSDAFTDLTTNAARKAIQNTLDTIMPSFNWTEVKHTSETAVFLTTANEQDNNNEIVRGVFLVFCSGFTRVTGGVVNMEKEYSEILFDLMKDMLISIVKIPQTRNPHQFIPSVLPDTFRLTFNEDKTVTEMDGITIGVPDGFKSSTDQKIIGNRVLSIVRQNEPFWDGTGDQSRTTLDFSIMTVNAGKMPDSPEYSGTIAGQIIDQTAGLGVFNANDGIVVARVTENASVIYQPIKNSENDASFVLRGIAILKGTGKIFTIRAYYHKVPDRLERLLFYEAGELAIAFFRRIRAEGKDLYDYSFRTVKTILGTKPKKEAYGEEVWHFTGNRKFKFRICGFKGNGSPVYIQAYYVPWNLALGYTNYMVDLKQYKVEDGFEITTDYVVGEIKSPNDNGFRFNWYIKIFRNGDFFDTAYFELWREQIFSISKDQSAPSSVSAPEPDQLPVISSAQPEIKKNEEKKKTTKCSFQTTKPDRIENEEFRGNKEWKHIYTAGDEPDFRSVRWGMTEEEVKAVEGDIPDYSGKPDGRDAKYIGYDMNFMGNKMILAFYFGPNGLYEARYIWSERHSNESLYITDYDNVKAQITKKYGSPWRDNEDWDTASHQKNYSGEKGKALSLGYLSFETRYETSRSNITMKMSADNYNVSFIIYYESKKISAPVEDYSDQF